MSLRLFSLLALGILVVFSGGFYLGSLLNFPSPDFNPTQESPRINPFGIRNDTGLKKENAESTQSDLGSSMPNGEALVIPSERERMRIRLRQIRTESNPITRFAALTQAMKDLNPDNLPQALELFESIPFGFENAQEYRLLLYAWSQFDPLGAINYCKSRASGIGAGFAVSGVLEGWAARDPDSAKAWVEDPANSRMVKLHNFGLVRGWAATDLKAMRIKDTRSRLSRTSGSGGVKQILSQQSIFSLTYRAVKPRRLELKALLVTGQKKIH